MVCKIPITFWSKNRNAFNIKIFYSPMMKNISIIFFLLLYLSIHSQDNTNPFLSSHLYYEKLKSKTRFNLDWINLGPVVNSGRVEAIEVDVGKPGTMYSAFGSGNLWKTINGGLSWKPIFDQEASHGIGDIALAPSDPEIIYVGTGENLRKQRNFTIPGSGMYRSDNGGETFNHIGMENNWHTGKIEVHPNDPNIVFVAAMGKFWSRDKNRGIYRTMDGGKNWKQVLYVDNDVLANDIVISPSNPNVMYAAMWQNDLDKELFGSIYGEKSGIYKSEDGGISWDKMSGGLPVGKIGRIGLAVSQTDSNKIYALIDNHNNKREETPEVYQSIDGGVNWQKTHNTPLKFASVIGWYFSDIYLNPQDDDEVYVLGVRLMHSIDGGKNFDLLEGKVTHLNPSAAQTLHLDQCELWINPLNPSHLVLGNDGGLFSSSDKGQSWLHHNNIPVGEFYDITLDQNLNYLIYGGTQDNATVVGPPMEWKAEIPDKWKYLWIDSWSGGDGCITQIDPNDTNTLYFSMQNGNVLRRDVRADTSKYIKPKHGSEDTLSYHYNFITPYKISKYNSNTLYHAGNYVHISYNRGDKWTRISPNLSTSSFPDKYSFAAGAFGESNFLKGEIYIGMDKGAFWVSSDNGVSWEERSHGLGNAYIRCIYPSHYKKNRIYLSMTGLNYDDTNPYLYVTEDKGKTWKNISINLPNEPVNVIKEDEAYEDILYAGTHKGLFISMDRGMTWDLMNSNMPRVPISDIEFHNESNDLIVSTHGRGIYKLNLNPIYEVIKESLHTDNEGIKFKFLNIKNTLEPKIRDTHRDVELSSIVKPIISFWSNTEKEVLLIIYPEKGEGIAVIEYDAKKGLNQFRWDLVLRNSNSDLPYFFRFKSYAVSGKYQVRIIDGQYTYRNSFIMDSRR